MRQAGKNNRQRGRGRRNGHNGGQINRNTTMDSNGPDVRLRGNAQQLHEKYIALANDAAAASERIQAEAYFQFADHYFRVNAAIMAAAEERRERQHEHFQPKGDSASAVSGAASEAKASGVKSSGVKSSSGASGAKASSSASDGGASDETSDETAPDGADE